MRKNGKEQRELSICITIQRSLNKMRKSGNSEITKMSLHQNNCWGLFGNEFRFDKEFVKL